MALSSIQTQTLKLNPHNDRHGSLKDEPTAIQWLLDNKSAHMRELAKDLADKKRLYEYPLIHVDDQNYIVFDGNRRVCCLKLILEPKLAPSEKWVNFFSELSTEEVRQAFSSIQCEIEAEMPIIDEKLFRRHTGSQDGVGQSQWDAEGKSNFLNRTGKESIGIGQSIENLLKSENKIPHDTELPWSNLERLFSSEPIRKRAGISFSGGQLIYLRTKEPVLDVLTAIARDLTSKKIVLEDIWNNQKKSRYLDKLKASGLAIDAPVTGSTAAKTSSQDASQAKSHTRNRVTKDKNLISSSDQNPFMHIPEMERAEKIWRELQFNLEFDQHDNAIAVLMRVLLELSISYYARIQGLAFQANDGFARRVSATADSMLNRKLIDTKGRSIIRKFESDKPIVSAHSMHQYVHNQNFHPTRTDMKAIWHVIRELVIHSTK